MLILNDILLVSIPMLKLIGSVGIVLALIVALTVCVMKLYSEYKKDVK